MMNKRFGAEAKFGIGGGGIVSEESEQKYTHLRIAEDLCLRGKPNDAAPYLLKALEDKNNFDADIQMAYLSPDLDFSIEVLEFAEARARSLLMQRLGPNCFHDEGPCVGRFYEIILTRPYMRVLQALGRMCFETKQYEKGANTLIEMLRLCPGDNLGQRFWLGPFLIRSGRVADALSFCQTWLNGTVGGGTLVKGGTAFQAPSRALLTAEDEAKYVKYAACDLVHTAALAAFKLWGRCPQAAQFLRIAAAQFLRIAVRTNPNILVKVIGRRSRPTEGVMTSRARNGPEDAHDYLWMAQDLWMESEVWDWVNEDPTVKAEVLKCCSRPECTAEETFATEFKRCSACRQVMYCGPTCQKADWKRHKSECLKEMEHKRNLKNVLKGKPTTMEVYTFDSGQI